jgi:type III secretion protein Q
MTKARTTWTAIPKTIEAESKVTTEYLDNDAGTFVDSLPVDATGGEAQVTAETSSEDETWPHEESQAAGQAPTPDQDDVLAEAKALFAEIDADASDETAPGDAQEDAHSDLDAVPVALSFELGKVSLPLADVRLLGPGGVVLFSDGSPASIAIVSAGQTLGRGELVDVEGRLGIRVTQWRTPC